MPDVMEVLDRYPLYRDSRKYSIEGYVHVLKMTDGSIIFANLENNGGYKPLGEFIRITPDGKFIFKFQHNYEVDSPTNREILEMFRFLIPNWSGHLIRYRYRKWRIYISKRFPSAFRDYEGSGGHHIFSITHMYEGHDIAINETGLVEIDIEGNIYSGKEYWHVKKGYSNGKKTKRKTSW